MGTKEVTQKHATFNNFITVVTRNPLFWLCGEFVLLEWWEGFHEILKVLCYFSCLEEVLIMRYIAWLRWICAQWSKIALLIHVRNILTYRLLQNVFNVLKRCNFSQHMLFKSSNENVHRGKSERKVLSWSFCCYWWDVRPSPAKFLKQIFFLEIWISW